MVRNVNVELESLIVKVHYEDEKDGQYITKEFTNSLKDNVRNLMLVDSYL